MVFRQKGFTLLELLIVVAIVGILAAIAWPAYQKSVNEGQRTDAKTTLTDLAAKQERFYTLGAPATYASDVKDLGNASSGTTMDSEQGIYTITLTNKLKSNGNPCSNKVGGVTVQSCFILTATPKAGGGQEDDPDCWSMSINEQGDKWSRAKGASSDNAAGTCW